MKTIAPVLLLLITDLGTTNPVSVSMTSPVDGSVVSNTITLSATASSTMGPITKVEFYVDGVLVGVASNNVVVPVTGLLVKLRPR